VTLVLPHLDRGRRPQLLHADFLENTLKELSTKEAFNKKILHSARTAIVVLDEVGIVTDFNPAAKSLLSLEKEMNIAQFIRFKTESFFEDVLSNLFAPNMMDLGEFEKYSDLWWKRVEQYHLTLT
jgi:transcriptional regulator with PAS, ATPase and Fis domain